jgi:preprotein translocase subunit SecG
MPNLVAMTCLLLLQSSSQNDASATFGQGRLLGGHPELSRSQT